MLAILLTLILCGQACGYHVTTGTGQLPAGGTAIAIPVVDNRTPEVAASPAFTTALRDSAFRAGLNVVGGDGPQLQGTILTINAVPRGVVILDGQFRSREQEIVVEVRLRLDEPQRPPWERVLVERVSYLSGPDLRDSEANRLLALRTALRRLADRGIDALTRKF